MKVLVLGGDGYLGWPTALHFSARDHEVAVVDNFSRRRFHRERGSDSLTPIQPLDDRLRAWREVSGREIALYVGNVCQADFLEILIEEFQPQALIHFAEQPSAPYSMIDRKQAVFTHENNVLGTLNVLFAIRDYAPQCHLVKLGTMGVYGTPNIDIEEGFIEIHHNGRKDILPFPKQPGSFYHLTKVHDSHNLMFACRTWGLAATDLNQGVVYGIDTEETSSDERLITRFDYDECFGTVLNRFCVEAVIGRPLTVYGKGGQTRGFLNIKDTLRCVELAASHPAEPGEYRVFNQFTEQFSIRQLAEVVARAGTELGIRVEVESIQDPRVEREEHYYNPKHTKLLELGLQPCLLSEELIERMLLTISRYQDRVISEQIEPSIRWAPGAPVLADG